MPTDQSHIVAFLGTLSGLGVLGILAFVYIWRTTKPRTEQRAFEFTSPRPKGANKEIQRPPMARV